MRRVLFAGFLVLALGAGYILSPFVAAYTLREAIKAGDTATIERKVVWPTVRETLRASIAKHRQLLPEANELGERVKPTMWQRVKMAFGASMLDRFIESYVTPEGLPKLFRYRRMWSENVKGAANEDILPFSERAKMFYRRIVRAEFKSPTRVEIEIADQDSPDRRYLSVMELHGTEWKLAELSVSAAVAASAGSAMAADRPAP